MNASNWKTFQIGWKYICWIIICKISSRVTGTNWNPLCIILSGRVDLGIFPRARKSSPLPTSPFSRVKPQIHRCLCDPLRSESAARGFLCDELQTHAYYLYMYIYDWTCINVYIYICVCITVYERVREVPLTNAANDAKRESSIYSDPTSTHRNITLTPWTHTMIPCITPNPLTPNSSVHALSISE